MFWRYEGIVREHWTHTAELLAMLYNCHRPEGAGPASPDDFNQAIKKDQKKAKPRDATPDDLAFCRKVFKRG